MTFRRSRILLALLTLGFGQPSGQRAAYAQQQTQPDMQQVQKKIEELEKELNELKKQVSMASQLPQQAIPGPSNEVAAVTRQAEEKAEQVKQSNSLNFYGYAMLDSGYNFGSINPDWFDTERPTQLPSSTGLYGPNGNTFWGVRQTRFGVKSSTDTPLGELKTIFEFELFGTGVDAGQTTFRLRHAWGELGHFGAGQTWSPFMDIDVFPNSLEYWGPNGMVFFRNVQVRWMPINKGNHQLWFALERPGASGDQGTLDRVELQNIQ